MWAGSGYDELPFYRKATVFMRIGEVNDYYVHIVTRSTCDYDESPSNMSIAGKVASLFCLKSGRLNNGCSVYACGRIFLTYSGWQQQCNINRLPEFGDRDDRDDTPDHDRFQAIVPAYSFNCSGRVTEWGACVDPGRSSSYDDDTSGCTVSLTWTGSSLFYTFTR